MRNTPLVAVGFLIATATSGQVLYELGPDIGDIESGLSASVDLDLLASDPDWIGFPTVDDGMIIAVQSSFEENEYGYVWTGRTSGSQINSTLIVGDKNGFFGTFGEYGSQRYEILGTEAGVRIRPLHDSGVPSEYEGPTLIRNGDAEQTGEGSIQSAASVNSASTANHTIDVLIVYTEEAENFWHRRYPGYSTGGLVGYAIQYANQAFQNSSTGVTLNLVHDQRMPSSADPGVGWGWSGQETLDVQTEDAGLHALRVQHNADIVFAYVYGANVYCGLAWTRGHSWSPGGFSRLAHAYLNNWCDEPLWGWYWRNGRWERKSFKYPYWEGVPHEIAHVMGAQHDKATGTMDAAVVIAPFAYGYRNNVDDVRTVMAGGNGTKLQYFSSATNHPNGWQLGVAGESENDRVVAMTAEDTSRFGDLPAAPTNLAHRIRKVSGKYSVTLYWTDNARNEQEYIVYWRRKGGSKNPPRVFPRRQFPNLTTDEIPGLRSGKTYKFWVGAKNHIGEVKTPRITVKIP